MGNGAVRRVMKDIAAHGITDKDVICLGDIVGYGPQPLEAVDLCMRFPST